ncbi:serine/arginine repetitive matrix protein 2 [Drosophila rhopaloa]|uniref:Serine/arginine repetitive matrix protein 2 n=1 Tax=Drosophila rhopaloa TaxID=1041015 RepID=A0ABM5I8L4_DRORH|nr:serine/arginine repetitive matrix protein 2 [Drosophila rhopaloa]
MKATSRKPSFSSKRGSGRSNTEKPPCKPPSPENDKCMDAYNDPEYTMDKCVQSQAGCQLQTVERSEQNTLAELVHIKSELFCEALCDVLDELGDFLDGEQDDSDLEAKPVITPPPPSISLADDSSLFTRRSKPDLEVESLQESGEISSSEANNTEESLSGEENPVRGINFSAKECQEEEDLLSSPEANSGHCWGSVEHKEMFSEKTIITKAKVIKPDHRKRRSESKERKRARRKSSPIRRVPITRSPSPLFRSRRRSLSRNSSSGKRRSSTASRRWHQSPSRDQKRSRRRSSSRNRLRRSCMPVSPRRRLRSRSRNSDRTSRSRSIRSRPSDRRLRHLSPSIRHRRRSPYRGRPTSPGCGRRHVRRHSPALLSRHRSRSRSRSARRLVREQLGNRVSLRERSRSRPVRKPIRKRSRSRSISAKVMLHEGSRSASSSRTVSKSRPTKARQPSRSPKSNLQEHPKSASQNQTVKSLADKSWMADQVASPVEDIPPQDCIKPPSVRSSPILPRPISPMITLHDNRLTRPRELRHYLLPTPPVPQMVYTHYTQLEYSAQHLPGYLAPGTHNQRPHELGAYDLRHRLSTTRSLYYLGPNDLRHRIQDVFRPDVYSPPPAFNAYAEWPTGYPGEYHPSGYY